MRKFLLLLCSLLLLLSACQRASVPATDQLSALLSLPTVSAPRAEIYFAQGDASARLDGISERLYGVPPTALRGLADYTVFLGCGTALYEIHILRAISASELPALRRMLESRANLLCLATEEGHPTTHNAIVCEKGLFLYLFATPHNEVLANAALS